MDNSYYADYDTLYEDKDDADDSDDECVYIEEESNHNDFIIVQGGILEGRDNDNNIAVKIPDYVMVICDRVFYGNKIRFIKIPFSVVAIGTSAFENCENLLAVYIPESVHEMESCCFRGCTSLKKVYVGAHIIGTDSFSDCICLKKAFISGTRLISGGAFRHCNQLEDVIITGRSIVESNAFFGCENLQNIYISAYSKIMDDAFCFCPNIKSVTITSVSDFNMGDVAEIVAYFKKISHYISIKFISSHEDARALREEVFGKIEHNGKLDLSDIWELEEGKNKPKVKTKRLSDGE